MLRIFEIAAHGIFLLFVLGVQVMFVAGMAVQCKRRSRRQVARTVRAAHEGNEPPYVCVMLAAYDEVQSLEKNCRRYQRVEYPKDRCELLILTEAEDERTSSIASAMTEIYGNVRHRVVPAAYLGTGHPHNKPRALAYGLTQLKPETAVVGILDAEDMVGVDMLGVAVRGIRESPIVQGRLATKNSRENLLSYWCGAEYAFAEVLQDGRDWLGWMKIPRGSTYFVRRTLIEKVGWSTRNVTEDLAFNVRMYASGHQTGLIDTVTWEESPVDLMAWIRQRTRWCQGALQTIGERIDLSWLRFMQRLSVHQLLYHTVAVPLLALLMTPLVCYDLVLGAFWSPMGPIRRADLHSYLWISSSLCLALICLEFAAATLIRYHGHRDLLRRVLACALLPLPFMILLPMASARAYWREWRGRTDWEKTPHRGETDCPEGARSIA